MIHPSNYQCLGEILRDALIQFKTDDALIEANRKRENVRLTYRDVDKQARFISAALERDGIGAEDRVAILMSNQSKWLIGAYAALYRGTTLVPLDYKLSPNEQLALITHAQPKLLIVE